MAKPVVAIVGRPNVGKSTFFNRCIGARDAIVYDQPGVTRDRIYRECEWSGYHFVLVDTGGLVPNSDEVMSSAVADQVRVAVTEADVVIFMVDGKSGLNGADHDVANMLRRTKKPVLVAVNKIDGQNEESNLLEFYQLGLGDPQSLSALRGSGGVGDLLDKVIEHLPEGARIQPAKNGDEYPESELEEEKEEPQNFSVAVIGKPNVGKSSLVNALSNSQRTIVSPIAGTTRDAIDTVIKHSGREITLVDTAGIRRKSKVDFGVEAFSVVRAIRAIDRSDVAVLMLDATDTVSDQDQKIAAKILEGGRAAVIALNKWDLIENKNSRLMNELTASIHNDLPHLKFAEVVFISAHARQRLPKILEAAERAWLQTRRRIGTGLLNQLVNEAQVLTPPPAGSRGKRLKIYYATQVSVAPPTFVLFVNDLRLMNNNYMSYLERKLRESFGFDGSPIRLLCRAKSK